MQRISKDSFSTAFQLDKATSEISINDIKVRNYYVCIYNNEWYICIATDISFLKQHVHFKFIKSLHNTFSWLRQNNFCWVPINNVFHSIILISAQGHRATNFKLNNEEYSAICKLFFLAFSICPVCFFEKNSLKLTFNLYFFPRLHLSRAKLFFTFAYILLIGSYSQEFDIYYKTSSQDCTQKMFGFQLIFYPFFLK